MKYLVMECHRSYAVVLAEDGRFLTVANLQYEVGQTVSKVVEMLEKPLVIDFENSSEEDGQVSVETGNEKIISLDTENENVVLLEERRNVFKAKSHKLSRWVSGFMALAACMVIAVVAGMRGSRTPYGSVYMTINPEIRVDVNRKKMVVGVEGLNEDGLTLLEGYSYYKKELDPVIDELVERAIAFGFLSDGGEISIELEAEDVTWAEQAGDELKVHLDEYLMENVSVTIDLYGTIVESEMQTGESGTSEAAKEVEGTDYGNESGAKDGSDYGVSDYESEYNQGVPEEKDHPVIDEDDDDEKWNDSGYGQDHDSGYNDYNDKDRDDGWDDEDRDDGWDDDDRDDDWDDEDRDDDWDDEDRDDDWDDDDRDDDRDDNDDYDDYGDSDYDDDDD